jgi:hypothetical protein
MRILSPSCGRRNHMSAFDPVDAIMCYRLQTSISNKPPTSRSDVLGHRLFAGPSRPLSGSPQRPKPARVPAVGLQGTNAALWMAETPRHPAPGVMLPSRSEIAAVHRNELTDKEVTIPTHPPIHLEKDQRASCCCRSFGIFPLCNPVRLLFIHRDTYSLPDIRVFKGLPSWHAVGCLLLSRPRIPRWDNVLRHLRRHAVGSLDRQDDICHLEYRPRTETHNYPTEWLPPVELNFKKGRFTWGIDDSRTMRPTWQPQ